MATNFDRWEKDPFFPAAEEVQDSADRMESTYKTLMHASKESSVWNSDALQTDLQTALGTTKWQLEEFERAVKSSYSKNSTDDAKDRHRDFITAMESHISKVESSWNKSGISKGKPPRPLVRLDEGERKELALFLSGLSTSSDDNKSKINLNDVTPECSKFSGHRRAASAGADMGSWKISVSDDVSHRSFDGKIEKILRKVPSFSGFLNTLESASRFKWTKKDKSQESDGKLLETRPLIRGNNGSRERCTSLPELCDDYYDKWLHGWCGAVQRQLQRSQYYIMYTWRTQMVFWVLVVIYVLALVVIRVI